MFGGDESAECPECGSTATTRKPSAFAFKTDKGFTPAKGSSCKSCTPGPGGCSGCSH